MWVVCCAQYDNRDAEAVILAAIKEGGGVRARFKLADLYLQQGKLECARLEYKNILELDGITCGERSMAEDKQRNIQSQFFFSTQLTSDSPVTIWMNWVFFNQLYYDLACK